MSIQFSHYRNSISRYNGKGGTTFAVEINQTDAKNYNIGDCVNISMGIAKCSDKDCFNKKIGRELSSSRLKNIEFNVISIRKSLDMKNSKISTRIILKADNTILTINQSSQNSKFQLFSVEIF